MNRDAIKPIIAEAIRFCVRNFDRLIMLGFLPGSIYVVLLFALSALFGIDRINQSLDVAIADSVLSTGAKLVLVPFYVAWHRSTLIGNAGVSGRVLPMMGRRDGLYVGYTLLLYLTLLPVEILTMIVPSGSEADESLATILGSLVLFLSFPVLLVWAYIRVSFLFVDTAVDGRATIREAWNMTRGNAHILALITLPMTGVIYLICLGWAALVVTPVLSYAGYGGSWVVAIFGVANASAMVIAGAYWISATSIAYRDVTGWTPDQPPAAQTAA